MNKNLRSRNLKLIYFDGATSCQLLHNINALLEHITKCIVFHVTVKHLLKGSSQSSMDHLIGNLQLMIQKFRADVIQELGYHYSKKCLFCCKIFAPVKE